MNKVHTLGLQPKEMEVIEGLIHGCGDRQGTQYPKWIFTLVSGFIDCDRLDYLLRDSFVTGVPCSFRLDRILQNSRIVENQICFHPKIKK